MEIRPIETLYHGYRFRSRLEARWAVFFDSLGVPWEYEPEGFDLGDGTCYLPDFRVKCYGVRGSYEDEPFPLYIEVKGQMTETDVIKIKKFAYGTKDFEIVCPIGYGLIEYSLSAKSDHEDGRHYECNCGCSICSITEMPHSPVPCTYDKSIMICDPRYAEEVEIKNPILIVGNIPSFMGSHDSRIVSAYDEMDGCDIYPFNYELIDGDYFAAYPAAHNGKFYLWGDDSSYINREDVDDVERAYDAARQARFEHGETPNIFR